MTETTAKLIATLTGLTPAQIAAAQLEDLDRLRTTDPARIANCTESQRWKLAALIALLNRTEENPPRRKPGTPETIQALLRTYASTMQEHCFVVTLDSAAPIPGILDVHHIYIGGRNQLVISPADILRPVIADGATRFILVHTHPNDEPTQSVDDVRSTTAIGKAAAMVDIHLMDHVIVSRQGYFSMAQAGSMLRNMPQETPF